MEHLLRLLDGSPSSSPSWLQRPNSTSVTLIQPYVDTLSKIFPPLMYRHVEFRDVEAGSLRFFSANMVSSPMKMSSFFCDAKIPLKISPLGKQQMQKAVAESGTAAEVSMLVVRQPRDIQTEQDPTLVLIQWFRSPGGAATMLETAIHTQLEDAVRFLTILNFSFSDYARR